MAIKSLFEQFFISKMSKKVIQIFWIGRPKASSKYYQGLIKDNLGVIREAKGQSQLVNIHKTTYELLKIIIWYGKPYCKRDEAYLV